MQTLCVPLVSDEASTAQSVPAVQELCVGQCESTEWEENVQGSSMRRTTSWSIDEFSLNVQHYFEGSRAPLPCAQTGGGGWDSL